MNKITLFLFMIFGLLGFSQPVINGSDFDNLNFSYTRKVASSSTINQGAAGANVTWNFSSLTPVLDLDPNDPSDTGITTVTRVASGPFSSNFPTSNYVLQIGNGTTNTSSNYYEYFSKTATKLETLGGGNNNQIDYSYSNPSTAFVYPFSFGMTNTDTSQDVNSTIAYSETQTYDAYGTLITPFGTFTNAIRIKTENPDDSTETLYTWYKVNPFRNLLTVIVGNALGDVNFIFADPTVLSNKKFDVSEIEIFPNPATNFLSFRISYDTNINRITITDLSGKKIIDQNGNSNTINIENLAKGMYVLEVVSRENKMVKKFIKN